MQCNGNDLKVFMILFQKFIFSDDFDYFYLKLSSKFGDDTDTVIVILSQLNDMKDFGTLYLIKCKFWQLFLKKVKIYKKNFPHKMQIWTIFHSYIIGGTFPQLIRPPGK